MSNKSAFENAEKNSSHKNHVLFLKIVICLKSFFLYVFDQRRHFKLFFKQMIFVFDLFCEFS